MTSLPADLSGSARSYLRIMVGAWRRGYAGEFAFDEDEPEYRDGIMELVRAGYLSVHDYPGNLSSVRLTAKGRALAPDGPAEVDGAGA